MIRALVLALLLVACRTPAPREIRIVRLQPVERCTRPPLAKPPAAPPMTGDESIDRHRKDWHYDRLIVWTAYFYEVFGEPVGHVVPVRGR